MVIYARLNVDMRKTERRYMLVGRIAQKSGSQRRCTFIVAPFDEEADAERRRRWNEGAIEELTTAR